MNSNPVAAEWLDNDALYRLDVTSESSGQVFMLDLRNRILPDPLDNGVSVYTTEGNPASYSLAKDKSRIFLGHQQEKGKTFQIYFGYAHSRPMENWDIQTLGEIPEKELSFKLRRLKILNENKYVASKEALELLVQVIHEPRENMLELQKLHQSLREVNHKLWQVKRDIEKKPDEKQELEKNKIQIEQQQRKLQGRIEEIEKTMDPKTLEEGHHKSIWSENHSASHDTKGVSLDQNMVGNIPKNEHFAARFDGKLFIDTKGAYEFAINSNDSSILYLDGKPLLSVIGKGNRGDSWEHAATINLDPGLYDFSLHVVGRKSENVSAKAAWKKPGENNFHEIEKRDFANATPVSMTRCSARPDKNVPIISYELNGHFVLEESEPYDWIICRIDDPHAFGDPVWLSDKTTISKSRYCSFLRVPDSDQILSLSSASGNFENIPIQIPEQIAESARLYPEIELKLWTPPFIYDDEILDMDHEIVSGLPKPGKVILKITTSKKVSFISEETECMTLKGRDLSSNERFAPPSRVKHNISIIGEELKDGIDISLYLMIPPVIFSQHDIRFLPVRRCAGIQDSLDGLVDNKGCRVIPVLHRPTLAEKRIWSLPKKIISDISSTKRILVIADNFGHGQNSLEKSLQILLATKKTSVEFVPWQRPQIKSAMLSSIGRLIPLIARTNADTILIIPPAGDVSLGLPVRTQKRAIAALIESARTNKNIRIIQVASPFPSLRRTEIDSLLAHGIKRMAEDYNVKFIDINAFIRKKPGWRTTYRFDQDNDVLYEPYPVHYTPEIARFISDSL
ncbi:MAG: hypothetical protein JW808_08285 [Victivallales bacterium]|nr:hypothetical protein [Victivallales bacterium]